MRIQRERETSMRPTSDEVQQRQVWGEVAEGFGIGISPSNRGEYRNRGGVCLSGGDKPMNNFTNRTNCCQLDKEEHDATTEAREWGESMRRNMRREGRVFG